MRTLSLLVFLTACATSTTPATPDAGSTTETEASGATGEDAGGEAAEGEGEADDPTATEDTDAAADASAAGMADMEAAKTAQSEVHAMMPKKEAMAKLEGLGDPASASDTEMTWMTKEGDACKQLKVTFMGDMVGAATLEDADCPAAQGDAGE